MFKRLIIVMMLLLTGCGNRVVTCKLVADKKSINLDITANNDDITSIKVRTCFELPNSLYADDNFINELNKQLDDSYHYEDNLLVSEYDADLDKTYSLNKTIEYLRKEEFYCE